MFSVHVPVGTGVGRWGWGWGEILAATSDDRVQVATKWVTKLILLVKDVLL
jgi:hypothetical protein